MFLTDVDGIFDKPPEKPGKGTFWILGPGTRGSLVVLIIFFLKIRWTLTGKENLSFAHYLV